MGCASSTPHTTPLPTQSPIAAPPAVAAPAPPSDAALELCPGRSIEACDVWVASTTSSLAYEWRDARVLKLTNEGVYIAWRGYSSRWDTFLPFTSGRIRGPRAVLDGGVVSEVRAVAYRGVVYPPSPQFSRTKRDAPDDSTLLEMWGLEKAELLLSSFSRGGGSPRAPNSTAWNRAETEEEEEEEPEEDGATSRSDVPLLSSAFEGDSNSDEVPRDAMVAETNERLNSSVRTVPASLSASIASHSSGSSLVSSSTRHVRFVRGNAGTPLPQVLSNHPETSSSISSSSSSQDPTRPHADEDAARIRVHHRVAHESATAYLRSRFSESDSKGLAGMTGLLNPGNDCFLNSVLQALGHVESLAAYVCQTHDAGLELSACPGVRLVGELVRQQWSEGRTEVRDARKLRRWIGEARPDLKALNRQHDANETLVMLLDALHEGLNRVKRRPTYAEICIPAEEEAEAVYWENFERGNDSIIKDLFTGQLSSTCRCAICGETSVVYDVFNTIELSLPPNAASKPVDVTQLLQSFCAKEVLRDGFRCPKCHKRTPCAKKLDFSKLPRTLILTLKRFTGSGEKIATPARFPLSGLSVNGKKYRLVSTIDHYGDGRTGHYVANGWNPVLSKWVRFDDARCGVMTGPPVGEHAYILIYVEERRESGEEE